MALSFLSGSTGASRAKYFDIRLDDDYIVFRGNEQEAASAHLKGTLVLCLSEPLTIKHVKLQLSGISRISWPFLVGAVPGRNRQQTKEQSFFEKTWKFRDAGKGKTEILQADNYEFPFDIVLPGSLPESIEGLHDTWISYRFKAEIGRKYTKDIHVRKPLRIIRTLDPSALELSHVMSVENIWPQKLEYSISIPSKAVIFGTSLRTDFRLVPLLKNLRIGTISTQFVESYDLTARPHNADLGLVPHKSTKIIMSDSFDLDREEELVILNEEVEGYQFSRVLDMPKSLTRCMQDTDAKGIKIRHKLKFKVQLHNPDGHTSELRATLPVHVFISPNLPLDDNNNLIDQSPNSAGRTAICLAQQAPPLYSEHHFDMLYSELDPQGYQTPDDHSDPGTPLGIISQNTSAENLASAPLGGDNISPSALHSRLSNLPISGSGAATPPPEESSGFSTDGSSLRSRPMTPGGGFHYLGGPGILSPVTPEMSRRPSEEENNPSGVGTPRPQFREVEDLCRVPSYSTAVKTTARSTYSADLPNYQTATAGETPPRLQTPASGQQSPSRNPTNRHFTFAEALPQFPVHSRGHSRNSSYTHGQDSERRFRILQARARC